MKRFFLIGALVLMSAPLSLHAQQFTADERAPAYKAERQLLESTMQTIVAVIQEATLQNEGSGLGDRLRDITSQLARAAHLVEPSANRAAPANDLDDLRRLLLDVTRQLEAISEELEKQESYDLADQVRDVRRDVRRAVREVDRLSDDEDREPTVPPRDGEEWLRPGRYDKGAPQARRDDDRRRDREERKTDREREREAVEDEIDREREAVKAEIRRELGLRDRDRKRREDGEEDDWEEHDDRWRKKDRRRRSSPFDWRGYTGTFVGEYSFRWPYRRETALYRAAPAIRYNRVEGLVAGIGRRPLEWSSYSRATIYGQVGYAFELKDLRATVGVETRLDRRRDDVYGLKIGGAYRFNTDTRDRWKTSWLENSLAAFLFENDFFDYYQVEGWTLYAVQRLTPYLQLSAGYRDEDYSSLDKNTGWSLFKGDGFALNPAIDDGEMRSFVFAVEGGRVVGLHSLPRGAAFRVEVELGDGLGGDFAFNRYVADGRAYVPVTTFSSLGLRVRGGLTEGDFIPLQKQFTVGGIGSVRGLPQNSYLGTRMLLANAEYIIDDVNLFGDWMDGFQLIGFADLGWTNTFGTNEFDFDDVIPSAGFGLGLDDRAVRLELAFPLRDFGTGRDPSLWLRITPSF